MTIEETPYVAIPEAEFRRLTGAPADGLAGVDAAAYAQQTIAATLRAARVHAKLTQADIAGKLKVGQSHVSNCEAGRERVGAALVGRWLKACGLPATWKPAAKG